MFCGLAVDTGIKRANQGPYQVGISNIYIYIEWEWGVGSVEWEERSSKEGLSCGSLGLLRKLMAFLGFSCGGRGLDPEAFL